MPVGLLITSMTAALRQGGSTEVFRAIFVSCSRSARTDAGRPDWSARGHAVIRPFLERVSQWGVLTPFLETP